MILLDRIEPVDAPDHAVVTAIKIVDPSVGPLVTEYGAEQASGQPRLQQAEATFEALPVNRAAAQAYGGVAASPHRAERKTSARAFDALVTVTAMSRNLAVYTCNPRDVEGIEGSGVVVVPHSGASL